MMSKPVNLKWRNVVTVALSALALVVYFVVYIKVAEYGHEKKAGISRRVSVTSLPSVACVLTALQATQGITATQHTIVPSDAMWRPTSGRIEFPAYDVIAYECGDSGGKVYLHPGVGTQSPLITFDSTLSAPGDPGAQYPPARLDRIRLTLNSVYSEMSARCGPLPDASSVRETTY
ncbi:MULTISPECIES: hypothetical protein [Sorangium]|uniref:hypothetical protein n=1 Tax=Sorangium TaxID=39643 RepID=UPI0012FFCA9E|nr:hypothetical protein [Sorangium cellulosum]